MATSGVSATPRVAVPTTEQFWNSNFGIPDPKVKASALPEIYANSIKAAKDSSNVPGHYLPYEWSPQAKVAAENIDNPSFWHEPLAQTHKKVDAAMQRLRPLFNEEVPRDGGTNMTLKEGLRDARTNLDAYMNHDPKHPDFLLDDGRTPRNEVPRYDPKGALHPDDAKFLDDAGNPKMGTRLVFDMPAQAHLETILYRVPAEHVAPQHWPGFDDAASKITTATEYLTSKNPKGRPDVETAYKTLRSVKADLDSALRNAGAPSVNASPINRLLNRWRDFTPTEQRWGAAVGIGAVALGAGLIAAKAVHDG
jgi:hypothetical protein